MERVYAFVDGAHVRAAAVAHAVPMVDPALLAQRVLTDISNRHRGRTSPDTPDRFQLRRTLYFDAKPDGRDVNPTLSEYWDALEVMPDVEMGWGAVRGERNRRQKRVDTLLSVALLVGAYQRLFETSVLVAGDEDFVPAVDEVRRLGVRVILASVSASSTHASDRLIRSADRYVEWTPGRGWPTLSLDGGKTFAAI